DAVRDASPISTQFAGRGSWGDDTAAFTSLIRRSYTTIHSADSSAKVILGPLAYDWFYGAPGNCGGPPGNCGGIFRYSFLDDILKGSQSVKGYFDALGINAYIYFAPGWES